MHNSIFLQEYNDQEISLLQNKYRDCIDFDNDLIEFITNISTFNDRYMTENTYKLERVIYEYWRIIHIYKKNKTFKSGWAQSTYHNFLLSSSRIIEFLLYIVYKQCKTPIDNILDVKKDEIIYFYLLKNKRIYENKYIYIAIKNRVLHIYVNYYSTKCNHP